MRNFSGNGRTRSAGQGPTCVSARLWVPRRAHKASPYGGGAPGGGGEGRSLTALSVTACGRASSPRGGAKYGPSHFTG